MFLKSSGMSSGKLTNRCWTRYSGGYSSLPPVNTLPAPRAGITQFPLRIATSGVANRFWRHGTQSAQSIVTYTISSGMPVYGANVQRTNLEIMSLVTSNTPGGITTCIECSTMQITMQLVTNSCRAMFTEDSTCFDIIPILWVITWSPTCSIQCRSACLTTSRSGFSTSWTHTNGSKCTMQSGSPCLLTTTSHQKASHLK